MKYIPLVVWLSIKAMFRVGLGTKVWYRDRKYIVCNGVISNSWRLGGLENGKNGWVPRSECRMVRNVGNLIHGFCSHYRFLMLNWYAIWNNVGKGE
jgi:hypothetical protein